MNRTPIRTPAVAAFVLLAAPSVAQGVFIVDEAGGPGSQFTDLPPAIAAVPDGSTLRVRPGTYSFFTVTGKGLSIVGDDRNTVMVARGDPVLSIASTRSEQLVLLRNLTVGIALGRGTVEVRDTAGPVVFDSVSEAILHLMQVQLRSAANVQMHRCTFGFQTPSAALTKIVARDSELHLAHTSITGHQGPELSGLPGSTALRLVRSRCVAVGSTLTAGNGSPSCVTLIACSEAGPGGTAVEAAQESTFTALDTAVFGGRGVPEYTLVSPPIPASNGGDGIVLTGASQAWFVGASPQGGAAFGAAIPGAPFVTAPGSKISLDPAATPSVADLQGTPELGSQVRLALDAAAGSACALVVSSRGALTPFEPVALGSVLSAIDLLLPTSAVPAGGSLSIPYRVPASWPLGATVFFQFATVDPVMARLYVTNAVPLHVSR